MAGLMFPAAAQAGDFYVAANSNRTSAMNGGCSATNPCTLKAALEAAKTEGDVVHVDRGDYELKEADGPVVRSGVTVQGVGAARPRIFIDGTLKTEASTAKVPTRLRHLELVASLILEDNAVGTDLIVRMTETEASLHTDWDHSGNGGPSWYSIAVVLRGARLHQSLVVATGLADGGVEAQSSDSYLTSSTVIAVGRAVSATRYYNPWWSECYPVSGAVRFEVRNVIARGLPDPRGEYYKGFYDLEASSSGDCGVAWMVVSHSNFRTRNPPQPDEPGTYEAWITQGEGNQTTSDLTDDAAIFADAIMYRQRQGAPTRDAGTTALPNLSTHDIDGQARVMEGGVDIGADELPAPPVLAAPEAVEVGEDAATLRAVVTPNQTDTHVVFDYGASDAYGLTTSPQVLPAGGEATTVQARLAGLTPGTTHHYRVRAYNPQDGTQPLAVSGGDATFATMAPPAVVPPAVVPPVVPPAAPPEVLAGLTAKTSQELEAFRRKGFKVTFTIGRPGTAYVVKLTARLGGRTVTLAKARGTGGPGLRTVKLKPSKKTARLLRKFKRVKAKLVVTAGTATASRPVTLRR